MAKASDSAEPTKAMTASQQQALIAKKLANREIMRFNYEASAARLEVIKKAVAEKQQELDIVQRRRKDSEQQLQQVKQALKAKRAQKSTPDKFTLAYFDMVHNQVQDSLEIAKENDKDGKAFVESLRESKKTYDKARSEATWLGDLHKEQAEVQEAEKKLKTLESILAEKKEHYEQSVKRLESTNELSLNAFVVECCKNAVHNRNLMKKIIRLKLANAKLSQERDESMDVSIMSVVEENAPREEPQPVNHDSQPEPALEPDQEEPMEVQQEQPQSSNLFSPQFSQAIAKKINERNNQQLMEQQIASGYLTPETEELQQHTPKTPFKKPQQVVRESLQAAKKSSARPLDFGLTTPKTPADRGMQKGSTDREGFKTPIDGTLKKTQVKPKVPLGEVMPQTPVNQAPPNTPRPGFKTPSDQIMRNTPIDRQGFKTPSDQIMRNTPIDRPGFKTPVNQVASKQVQSVEEEVELMDFGVDDGQSSVNVSDNGDDFNFIDGDGDFNFDAGSNSPTNSFNIFSETQGQQQTPDADLTGSAHALKKGKKDDRDSLFDAAPNPFSFGNSSVADSNNGPVMNFFNEDFPVQLSKDKKKPAKNAQAESPKSSFNYFADSQAPSESSNGENNFEPMMFGSDGDDNSPPQEGENAFNLFGAQDPSGSNNGMFDFFNSGGGGDADNNEEQGDDDMFAFDFGAEGDEADENVDAEFNPFR